MVDSDTFQVSASRDAGADKAFKEGLQGDVSRWIELLPCLLLAYFAFGAFAHTLCSPPMPKVKQASLQHRRLHGGGTILSVESVSVSVSVRRGSVKGEQGSQAWLQTQPCRCWQSGVPAIVSSETAYLQLVKMLQGARRGRESGMRYDAPLAAFSRSYADDGSLRMCASIKQSIHPSISAPCSASFSCAPSLVPLCEAGGCAVELSDLGAAAVVDVRW